MTIQQAKIYGKEKLSNSPTPELDTSVLLQHITGFDKTKLLLNRDNTLSVEQEELFTQAIEKRRTGLPVAYITGHKEFYGYDFFVTPDVLIPKPDTEVLIDNALNYLGRLYASLEGPGGEIRSIPEVCDMCSGSGCVGLSILRSLIDNDGISVADIPKMTFGDISQKALSVTKKNAERLMEEAALKNLRFTQTNLFDNIPFKFQLIVTNPPYVPHNESVELLKDGRNEPLLALNGDVTEEGDYSNTEDGLELIRRLIPQCFEHLEKGGALIMETGEYNAQAAAMLFEEAGFKNVHIEKDLNDMMRNVIGEKPF